MITGGQGFTGRHITQRLEVSGRRVISYNRDFATDEDGVHMVQGELFDVPPLVRVLKEHWIEQIVHTAAMSHPTLSLDFSHRYVCGKRGGHPQSTRSRTSSVAPLTRTCPE